MRIVVHALAGAFLFTSTHAASAKDHPLTGRFEGTGRACYGTLAIEANTISWQTPFSVCKSIAYSVIGQDVKNERVRRIFRLSSHDANCRYAILALTHAGSEKDTGWEVTGYGSEQSYRAERSGNYPGRGEDTMSCYLIRHPKK